MTLLRRYFLSCLLLLSLLGCSQQELAAPFRTSVDQELILASMRGDGVGVWAALAAKADPDFTDRSGNTALIFAARDGHLAIAEILLEYGATVDWQDDEKVTPLILASSRNHPAIVTLLLNHGAALAIKDQWGRTALDHAERRGADDPIAVMLR